MKERIITSIAIIAVLLIVGVIDNKYLTGMLIGGIGILSFFEAQKLFNTFDEKIFYVALASLILSLIINPLIAAVFAVIVSASYIAYYQKDLKIISPVLYPIISLLLLYELYLKNSKYEKSIEWAKKANNINPENYESWYFFAKSLVKLGKRKKAEKILKAYIESYGTKPKIENLLRSLK